MFEPGLTNRFVTPPGNDSYLRKAAETGRVVATLDDYRAVRGLVADLVAEGVDANVKPEVRETVEAASRLLDDGNPDVRQTDLARALKLDKSSISRRVAAALDWRILEEPRRSKGSTGKACAWRSLVGRSGSAPDRGSSRAGRSVARLRG
jgi:hypothetical protein